MCPCCRIRWRAPRVACGRLLRGTLLGAAVLVAAAADAHAQAPAREFTLDVRPWSVDTAVAWRFSSAHLWGFAIGGGPDDFNHTFAPHVSTTSSEFVTLEQAVRLGPFYRYENGERLSVDVSLRLALGGVRGISGSPGLVTGVQTGVFYGWRTIRAGPRLLVGVSREGGETHIVVHVDWLTARVRLPF